MNWADYERLAVYLPDIWQGFLTTLMLSATTLVLATPIALALALARESRIPALAVPAAIYVGIFRMVPVLMVLFFCFYALPQLGVRLQPLTAAVLGLSIVGAAYMSEDIRGGIAAVDPGQYRASRALGLSYAHMIRRIVLPQAIPLVIPPYITRAIIMVKGTSLASFVAVGELTAQAVRATSISYEPFAFLVAAGLLYLVLSGGLAILQAWAERRFRVGGRRPVTVARA